MIIEKNCNNWKRLWLLKKIVIIEKDWDNKKFGGNINEVVRAVLNFLLFFLRKDCTHAKKHNKAQKSTKKTKGTKRTKKIKTQTSK